jgi:hypothetical protein
MNLQTNDNLFASSYLKAQQAKAANAVANSELEKCKGDRVHWFNTYLKIHNPKIASEGSTLLPFVLRPKQIEMDKWWSDLEEKQDTGIIRKSREEGATWYAVGRALHTWLFVPGAVVTLGSRKEEQIDKRGDPDSLFAKIMFCLENLPQWMHPEGFNVKLHRTERLLLNPSNGASIRGEAGDRMGRGGRSYLYVVDEWDFVERPEIVSRSINENARCRIYISTVAGPGTFMAAQEQVHPVFTLHWKDNPEKNHFVEVDGKIIYPWYEKKKAEYAADPVGLAREIDANRNAASPGALIPHDWIKSAQTLVIPRGSISASGLDVSADRGDRIIYANRKGAVLTAVKRLLGKHLESDLTEELERDEVETLYFDRLGVGAYAIANVERTPPVIAGQKLVVAPIANSEKASRIKYHDRPKVPAEERFYNRAAELGWALRLRFMKTHERVQNGVPHPDDECISLAEFEGTPLSLEIETQLSTPIYDKDNPAQKIKVEKKGLGNTSPDIYEAIMYAFATEKVQHKPTFMFGTEIWYSQ